MGLRDADWDLLWTETSSLASDLSCLRRCRRTLCAASLLVAAIAVAILIADLSLRNDAACSSEWTLATIIAVSLWLTAGIIGCCASHRSMSCARHLEESLTGAD